MVMISKEEANKFNILMFPWLGHGHLSPFLELAKRITTSKPNITIHFCSTPVILDFIRPRILDHESDSIKLVPFVLVSSKLPPEQHTTKNLPFHLIPTLLEDCRDSISSFIDVVGSIKPDLLIYDIFSPWAAKYAKSRGIPRVNFAIVGAGTTSFYHHQHTYGFDSTNFPYPEIYLRDVEKKVDYMALAAEIIKDVGEGFAMGNFELSDEIVLVKSSRVIEDKYINYLAKLSNRQIVVTGPLVGVAEQEDAEVMKWLDSKKDEDVIYICFGSEWFLSKEQMDELAKGLELSKVNFIWVLRSPSGVPEIELPQGFSERVKNKGLFLRKWAPQTSILGHSSVRGFVSHCGWSSIIESTFYGVPIVGMPMSVDQPLNARVMVDAGVGVEVLQVQELENGNVSSGLHHIPLFKGEEIAKAIDKVVGNVGDVRERAKRFGDKIRMNEKEDVEHMAEQVMRLCINGNKQRNTCDV